MVRGKLMETLFPNFAQNEQKPTSESLVKLSQALQSLVSKLKSPSTYILLEIIVFQHQSSRANFCN